MTQTRLGPSVIRDAIPNKVDYSIHVVWGDGRLETYVGCGQAFLEAAEKLEILAAELREAVKVTA